MPAFARLVLDGLRQPPETAEAVVARALADLECAETVRRPHIAEALAFRQMIHAV